MAIPDGTYTIQSVVGAVLYLIGPSNQPHQLITSTSLPYAVGDVLAIQNNQITANLTQSPVAGMVATLPKKPGVYVNALASSAATPFAPSSDTGFFSSANSKISIAVAGTQLNQAQCPWMWIPKVYVISETENTLFCNVQNKDRRRISKLLLSADSQVQHKGDYGILVLNNEYASDVLLSAGIVWALPLAEYDAPTLVWPRDFTFQQGYRSPRVGVAYTEEVPGAEFPVSWENKSLPSNFGSYDLSDVSDLGTAHLRWADAFVNPTDSLIGKISYIPIAIDPTKK